MATVDITNTLSSPTLVNTHSTVFIPTRIEISVDLADVAKKKGSALAQGDVVEALRLPANTAILWAGATKTENVSASALTVNVGSKGSEDKFVSGFDVVAAKEKENSVTASAFTPTVLNEETTIDLTLATLTGDNVTGRVSVWALVLDLSPVPVAGLAKVGS